LFIILSGEPIIEPCWKSCRI